MSKFKYGDHVLANGNKARVVSVWKDHDNNKYMCRVRFQDIELMPPEMDFPEDYLKTDPAYYDYHGDGALNVNTDTHCPLCRSEWHVDKWNKKWIDCLKCNKKKEDIMEEIKNSPPPIPKRTYYAKDMKVTIGGVPINPWPLSDMDEEDDIIF